MRRVTTGFATAALLVLCACGGAPSATPASPPATADNPASTSEQACLGAVAARTGKTNVRVVASTFSRAGTEVIVGVGPTGQWRCTAYADGTTAGIESLTDDGGL